MTRDEYGEWAKRHDTLFGFGFASDWDMLLSWFEVLGRHPKELLHKATAEMLSATVQATSLRAHLGILQGHVRNAVAVDLGREKELARDTLGTCSLCDNAGWVSVPWLRLLPDGQVLGVSGGEWLPVGAHGNFTWHTMAVTCSCRLGHNTRERHTDPDKKPMNLQTYQGINPHWREQLVRRQAEERKSRRLRENVGTLDQTEAWKEEMRRRWGLRQPGEEVGVQ